MTWKKEADFRRDVVKEAKANGWFVHWEVDHRFKLSTGFPDLVLARMVILDWRETAIIKFRELKMDDTYLKPTQDDWRVLLERAGLDYAVWRPRDWEMIKEELS